MPPAMIPLFSTVIASHSKNVNEYSVKRYNGSVSNINNQGRFFMDGGFGGFFNRPKHTSECNVYEKTKILINDPELWSAFRKELMKNHVVTSLATEQILIKFITEQMQDYERPSRNDNNLLHRVTSSFQRKHQATKSALNTKCKRQLPSFSASPSSSDENRLHFPKKKCNSISRSSPACILASSEDWQGKKQDRGKPSDTDSAMGLKTHVDLDEYQSCADDTKKECVKKSGQIYNQEQSLCGSIMPLTSFSSSKTLLSCSGVLTKRKSGSSKQAKLIMNMEQALGLTTNTGVETAL